MTRTERTVKILKYVDLIDYTEDYILVAHRDLLELLGTYILVLE